VTARMAPVPSAPYEGKVVALDVDGVLLDPTRGGLGRWDLVLQDTFGIDPASLQVGFFQRHWAAIATGQTRIEEPLEAALRALGCEADVEEVLRCWFETDDHLHEPMVSAAAEWAAGGARLVLATTQEHRRAAYLQERFSPLFPLDLVLYSAALEAQKPDIAFFKAASQAMTTAGLPQKVIFIDDLLPNIETARQHGWVGIHYQGQTAWRDEVETALRM
jgi:putative hydrolase of the HAD superfamily